MTVTPGRTFCFSARALDLAANLSEYSAWRCTSVPLKATNLTYSHGWSAGTTSAVYGGAYEASSTRDSKMTKTGVVAKRISLIATMCPSCGTLTVRWNGAFVKTVNLASKTTKHKVIVPLTTWSATHSGTLQAVVASAGKRVIVEGLAVYRD
jgi:hypothetical protein